MDSLLIKQGNSAAKSQPSMGIFGILRESFKTTSRNGKLLLPILLIVFLSFSQIDLARNYILEPVVEDFSYQLEKHPNMFQDFGYKIDDNLYSGALEDIREFLQVKILTFVFSSVISLLFLVATVSSSSEAYTAKVLAPKDMFLKIRKSWTRPIVTGVYMILITLGLFTLYLISFGIISTLAVNSWAFLPFGVLAFSIPVICLYMIALWKVSLVVSVLEDGSGGLKAIVRAKELIKGKRVQASLVSLLFVISYGVVHLMVNAFTSYNLNKWSQLAITIPFTNGLVCLLKLFMFVVYTVFYHERKMSLNENEAKGLYVPIAAGEV